MVRGLADLGAEGVLVAGAGRAILLQIANPAVGHGVAEHSNFADRPLERLRATLTYVYAVVYGTEDQVAAVRRSVNRAHGPVCRKPDAGSAGYSAFDAHAQLWVVATLYDTAVTVYERIYGAQDDEVADFIYRDYARLGTALQLPAELGPADREAFGSYWANCPQGLEADDVMSRVVRSLLYPRDPRLWQRVVMPFARFITAGLLPDRLRQGFGLPWTERHGRWFDRTMRWSAVVYPRLPRRVRHWPKNYCLGRLGAA
ncbi:oxygenase MpaB family protein [Arthrobacter sp. Y81]|uniref:oxygenase MpaB family protein n=1 Tax=Arthrobacter sp. Y81 TaxID=2058897 RepID=UPI000CE37255|nr:oxygenase MpaB family protein [Arthrobacter sp. Y81]